MIISQYYAHITDEIAARSAAFRLSHASTGLVDLDAIHRRVVEIDLANARHGKIARIAGEDTRLAQAMPHGVKIRDPDGKVAGNGWIDGQLVVHGKCGDGLHDVKGRRHRQAGRMLRCCVRTPPPLRRWFLESARLKDRSRP